MVNFRSIIILLSTATALAVGAARAEEPHDHHAHEHHTHEAHVHGAWELFAALDDKQLSVTVKGPLIDVLGFERRPADEKEYAAIEELKARLDQPELLFALGGGPDCALSEPVRVLLPEGFSVEHAEHESDAHKADKHKASHDHDHDHDAHDGDAHHADQDVHTNDLEVSYVFQCQSPERLRAITSTAFESFPSIETVEAVFLGDGAQKALRLTPDANTLRID